VETYMFIALLHEFYNSFNNILLMNYDNIKSFY